MAVIWVLIPRVRPSQHISARFWWVVVGGGGGGHGVVVVVVTGMKQRQLLGLSLSLVFNSNDLFAFSESPCRGKHVYLVKMVSLYDHFYDMNSC